MDDEIEKTTHVDNTLLETQAREKNEITSTKLLVSDGLNKQGEASEVQEKFHETFDVIQEEDCKVIDNQKKEKIKKGTNL